MVGKFARRGIALVPLCFLLVLSSGAVPSAAKWKPVDHAELALTASSIQKDADAEVLEWDTRMWDDLEMRPPNVVTEQYLRIKIFTDRGRENQSRVELPFGGDTVIRDLEARTVKKNGTIVELKKKDVYERDIVKAGGVKVKAMTFVFPEVEAGSIVEYRWRMVERGALTYATPLMFQREIPAKLISKHVRPRPGMHAQCYNMVWDSQHVEDDGFRLYTAVNMPALKDEPLSPPEMQRAGWMLVYYEASETADPNAYWRRFGRGVYQAYEPRLVLTPDIRKAAAEAAKDATSVPEKLQKIVAFCRRTIRRTDVDVGAAKPEKAVQNRSATDTLAHKAGDGADLVELVAAMARAAGLDARIAAVPSRAEMFSQRQHIQAFLRRFRIVAARDGGQWRFVDPANTYGPEGELRWPFEGQDALISDADEPAFATTPRPSSAYTVRKRQVAARLAQDGTLEADVTVEYTGHWGQAHKETEDSETSDERQKDLAEGLAKEWQGAEITAVRIENVTDPFKPYTQSYHLRFPAYAQRAGSRLLVQPALFQRGSSSRFPADRRTNDVSFNYAWKEIDTVTIQPPEGFVFEKAEAPPDVGFGDAAGYTIRVSADGGRMLFERTLEMGRSGRLVFPAAGYGAIKAFFDAVAKNDAFTVSAIKSGS